MKTIITTNESVIEKDIVEDASEFYSTIGKILGDVPIPNSVSVECEKGRAAYDITTRSGTRLVSARKNTISLPQIKPFPEKYLVMINADHNNYKFYHLKQETANGMVHVSWGRIGAKPGEIFSERSCDYPAEMFWPKFFEKTAKGYEDKSEFYLGTEENLSNSSDLKESVTVKKTSEKKLKNKASVILYRLLNSFSKQKIESTFVNSNITIGMYNESKRLLNLLYQSSSVEEFNNILFKLLAVSPRKLANVKQYIAKTNADFAKILDNEDSLVKSMEAILNSKSKSTQNSNDSIEGFEDIGIEIYPATDAQKKEVMKHLNTELQDRVANIYRVINPKQKERFDKYLKENNITKIKQFWHGSRNENWLSILNNGLLLHPNAVITGKMFGNGIYFAPSAQKSWNYTSYRNAYYTRGSSDTAFMALYATAYGNPLDCTCAHSYTKKELDMDNKNCVHAHAGSQLRNDEIIFYDEAAMVINYIVEFH